MAKTEAERDLQLKSERIIIHQACTSKRLHDIWRETLDIDCFSSPDHKNIWAEVVELKPPIDLLEVKAQLQKKNLFRDETSLVIADVGDDHLRTYNPQRHVARLMKHRGTSQNVSTVAEIDRMVQTDGDDPVATAARMRDITEKHVQRVTRETGSLIQSKARTAHQMLEADKPETRQKVIDSLCLGDVGLIMGPPEAGKTYTLLAMARAVAKGEKLYGAWTTNKRRVALFLQEDPDEIIRARIKAMADQDQDAAWLKDVFIFTADDLGQIIKWEDRGVMAQVEMLVREERIGLVLWDNWSYFAPSSESYDSNRDTSVGRQYEILRGFCLRTGCATIPVHHPRKGDGTHFRELTSADARGSVEHWGKPRWVAIQSRFKGTDVRKLWVDKSNYGVRPEPIFLSMDPATGLPTPTDAPEDAAEIRRNRLDLIASYLDGSDGWRSRGEIKAALEEAGHTVKDDTVGRYLRDLVEDDRIHSNGKPRKAARYKGAGSGHPLSGRITGEDDVPQLPV